MLTPFIRSSFFGSLDYCEQQCFLIYNLSLKEPGKQSTDAGTMLHKALELLALRKKAEQDGLKTITNEIWQDKKIKINLVTEAFALEEAWKYCKRMFKQHDWNVETKEKYSEMYYKLLNFRDGQYNPLKMNIVQAEQYFEFEIEEDWARYEYDIGGEKIDGFLKIKGTIDLITRNDEDFYESVDFKTGAPLFDWASGKKKSPEDLRKNKQLLLYYYAMVKLLKTYDICSTIYYLKDGPYQVYFDRDSYKEAENLIKERFLYANSLKVPRLTKDDGYWGRKKCSWCHFNKIDEKLSKTKTICELIKDEIIHIGMDKVIAKYADANAIHNYVGGGRGIKEKGTNC